MRMLAFRVGLLGLCGVVSLTLAGAQEAPPATQEIVIPPHWSPYKAPDRYPEGTRIHIIVKGDTLWDLANQYLANPFLWPQLWDANRYITNAHWIYPGDPLVIPEVAVVRPTEEAPEAPGVPGVPGVEARPPGVPGVPGPVGPSLVPLSEEVSIQCAGYVADEEDEGLRIVGSEEGRAKFGLASFDIVYLNKGSKDGISPGDRFYTQRRTRKVPHPRGGSAGWLILRSGWVTVLAVQEETAIAEITQACNDVYERDYLIPFQEVPVPLMPAHKMTSRLDPESGKTRGYIVASLDDVVTLGQGYLVSLDVGSEQGVIPGNLFTIYRIVYPEVPTPRKVLGEAAVLTVQRKTSTAKIIFSSDFIDVGDAVELK